MLTGLYELVSEGKEGLKNYTYMLVFLMSLVLFQLSSRVTIDLEQSRQTRSVSYSISLAGVYLSILLGGQSLFRLYRKARRTATWLKSQS